MLSVARHGYMAILSHLRLLTVNAFRVKVENSFLSAFLAGFNPVNPVNIMIAVVHTGGYTVIQVKHWRDINLKLSVYFKFV